jgi:hypothetical protein
MNRAIFRGLKYLHSKPRFVFARMSGSGWFHQTRHLDKLIPELQIINQKNQYEKGMN